MHSDAGRKRSSNGRQTRQSVFIEHRRSPPDGPAARRRGIGQMGLSGGWQLGPSRVRSGRARLPGGPSLKASYEAPLQRSLSSHPPEPHSTRPLVTGILAVPRSSVAPLRRNRARWLTFPARSGGSKTLGHGSSERHWPANEQHQGRCRNSGGRVLDVHPTTRWIIRTGASHGEHLLRPSIRECVNSLVHSIVDTSTDLALFLSDDAIYGSHCDLPK